MPQITKETALYTGFGILAAIGVTLAVVGYRSVKARVKAIKPDVVVVDAHKAA